MDYIVGALFIAFIIVLLVMSAVLVRIVFFNEKLRCPKCGSRKRYESDDP